MSTTAARKAWNLAHREQMREASRRHYWRNKERRDAEGRAYRAAHLDEARAYYLQWKYGLAIGDYDALVQKQAGGCAICRSTRPLVVDHDHADGRVRGLLCNRCNVLLGVLENQDFCKKAAAYLCR